jgi:hypothetical protein
MALPRQSGYFFFVLCITVFFPRGTSLLNPEDRRVVTFRKVYKVLPHNRDLTSEPTRFFRTHRTTMIHYHLYKHTFDTVSKN